MRVLVPGADQERSPDADPLRRLAGMAIAAAFLVPPRLANGGPVLCPFRRATGLPCPTCGLTRSWVAAMRGRPGDSLRFHPLGMLALVAAAAYAAGVDDRPGLGPGRPDDLLRRTRPVLVAGWLIAWLVRLVADARRGS